jgi:RNAse (barnase) inhibitor barstar
MPNRNKAQFEFASDLTGFRAPGSFVARLPGRLRRRQDLFRALAKALRLPGYFGNNWDALEECLRDRSWLGKDEHVVLLHEHLPLADSRQRKIYVEILLNAQSTSGGTLRIVFPESARARLA